MKRIAACVYVLMMLFFLQPIIAQNNKPVNGIHLNHIAVYVSNLATSTAFYQKIVGLDTIPEPFHDGRHTWFKIGGVGHLHIIQGAVSITAHDKNAHICFAVNSVDDFIKVLKKNNIEYENWAGEKSTVTNRVDGVKQLYFKDPDGYWLEINDAKD
jgi:lactoylglutathione lyase